MAGIDDARQPHYHALLASRLKGLVDLRARVWAQGQRSGTPVWVSEIDAKDEFIGSDTEEKRELIRVTCLKHVRSAPKFICLLDGSYGGTAAWSDGDISILELELATAAFSQRDIWIFRLDPYTPDPRIESLLKAIEISCPAARIKGPLTPDQVLANIAWLLEPIGRIPETLRIGPLVADLAYKRSPRLNFDLNTRDVQFLSGIFAPLFDGRPDKNRITRLLADAEAETVTPDRLAKLWIAIRHLSAAPFTDARNEEYLPLWEQALARWSSTSAWYGLHGHFLLGRLAAVNTLSTIRQRMPARMQKDLGPPSIFADAGAAASEYYSIAKLVPSRWQRHRLFGKALWNCNAALREGAVSDPSGLFDIRGHVKMRMFNPVGGIADLHRALNIRRDAGQSIGRIGESQMHLGRAYTHVRLYRRAERLLEEGVAKLRASGNTNFLVQGLRHLATFYAETGRRAEAIKALREAQAIAKGTEAQGQLQQIEDELRKLGEER